MKIDEDEHVDEVGIASDDKDHGRNHAIGLLLFR